MVGIPILPSEIADEGVKVPNGYLKRPYLIGRTFISFKLRKELGLYFEHLYKEFKF